MQYLNRRKWVLPLVVVLILSLPASAARTPRILMVGDSWPFFMWMFRSMGGALERAGLGQFCEDGSSTAIGTSEAKEWANNHNGKLDTVAVMLNRYPTIDIVHLSIGGNDMLGPWNPNMGEAAERTLMNNVLNWTETVIDFILAQRPDIRVGLCSYEYLWASRTHTPPHDDDYTCQQLNAAIVRLEHLRMALCERKGPRVQFINNYGLMQYLFGDAEADPPYAPGEFPRPTGPERDYQPFPAGNPIYPTPEVAMLDPHSEGIHLNQLGYAALADNCIAQVYKYWLTEDMGTFEVTSPNGGEQWRAGTVQSIAWLNPAEAPGASVRVGLHKGEAFVGWLNLKTDNDGAYAWHIPVDLPAGDDYRVRVQSHSVRFLRDFSNAAFSIGEAPLRVTSPNGGEQWTALSVQPVTWVGDVDAVGEYVRIGIHHGADFLGWRSFRTENDGEFHWVVPRKMKEGDNYRIRVQSFANKTIRDFSDGMISLKVE
ncbi:MAG TPA: hypothetical protein PLO37_22325 [Candidatus Hydrogenedentes bacterium]|nr:hypothetical protein [Candidatus Hydrogenedentota bacterium]HPG69593.1 hypothetical protein [Candidatus Hydrogenedentota bacterium]